MVVATRELSPTTKRVWRESSPSQGPGLRIRSVLTDVFTGGTTSDKGTFSVSRDRLILSGLETLRRKNTVLKLSMTELLIFERNVMLYLHHLH